MFGDNGHRGPATGHPVNDQRFWEDYAQSNEFPNPLKVFTEPGKDARELAMRSIFKDQREANAFVNYMTNVRYYGLEKEAAGEALLDWLATRVSINGIARRETLMAYANIIAPSLYPGVGNKFMKNQKRDKEPDGEES